MSFIFAAPTTVAAPEKAGNPSAVFVSGHAGDEWIG
jgi:hypothetical protein